MKTPIEELGSVNTSDTMNATVMVISKFESCNIQLFRTITSQPEQAPTAASSR